MLCGRTKLRASPRSKMEALGAVWVWGFQNVTMWTLAHAQLVDWWLHPVSTSSAWMWLQVSVKQLGQISCSGYVLLGEHASFKMTLISEGRWNGFDSLPTVSGDRWLMPLRSPSWSGLSGGAPEASSLWREGVNRIRGGFSSTVLQTRISFLTLSWKHLFKYSGPAPLSSFSPLHFDCGVIYAAGICPAATNRTALAGLPYPYPLLRDITGSRDLFLQMSNSILS